MVESSKPVGINWTRWEAHAQLTLAELLRFRFMLGQYHEVLRQSWDRMGRVMPPKKRLVFTHGKVPEDWVGPKQAKEEYDAALQYIERVINMHRGTPWEEAAKRLQAGVAPWKCELTDVPGPGGGGPGPPSLAF
jgi:hypothetical protein